MDALRIISADSHVVEPNHFWAERVDRKFRDHAPHVEQLENGRWALVAPGITPALITRAFAGRKTGTDMAAQLARGYEAAPPGSWDPAARMKDQDTDGVEAEVLYATQGMRLFGLPDKELQRACFRAFNDWMGEFIAYNPKRLRAIGLVSISDIDLAVAELEHCAAKGLSGALIPVLPPADSPYEHPKYDPLWAAASSLGLTLSLHAGTGQNQAMQFINPSGNPFNRSGGITTIDQSACCYHEIQHSFSDLLLSGVLDRFPKLRLVSVENGAGWMAFYISRLQPLIDRFGFMLGHKLKLKPIEYFRRHVWATFQEDPTVASNYQLYGEDNFMWASDFPHADTTWPESRRIIERDLGSLPPAAQRKIVFENVSKLYGLN